MSEPTLKPRRFDRDVDGILLLDKPVGLSSNQALQRARVIYRALKAGHAGSLDPLASGMLPVCFGQATKICGLLLDARKRYVFTARLGERTDTGDAAGATLERHAVPVLSHELIATTLHGFLGEQEQVPPMYSALKHQGERLYAIARRGEIVERASRRIVIESLTLQQATPTELQIEVRCSKGTYVRTLAEDIAAKLGTVAHLIALRRVSVEPFEGSDMLTLDALQSMSQEALKQALIPTDAALQHLPEASLELEAVQAVTQGREVITEMRFEPGAWLRMYGPNREFLGLAEAVGQGRIQPRRVFVKS